MAHTDKQFELRQLLKAYRKGLISDEIFEEQMREIQLGEETAFSTEPAAPSRTYRVRDKTFSSERDMLLHFLDEFRAGETFGGEVFGMWAAATSDPILRGGIRAVGARESTHGELLAARLREIGGEPRAELPSSFREAARERLGSAAVPDREKIGDFLRQIPDAEAAVAPIREVVSQIEEDGETCALLAGILEDELATIGWLHQTAERLGLTSNGAADDHATSQPARA